MIRELENKFQKIEAKLNSNEKQELISGNYSNDIETINQLFELKEAKNKNELNECRDEMLKELIAKRDQELNQVNHHPKENRALLKALDESIKSKHFVFSKGLASIYESILVRSKFSNPLKFAQLAKSLKFMKNEKKFCFSKAKHLFDSSIDRRESQIKFFILSSDLIFIYRHIIENWDIKSINMAVMNHSGKVIHFKSIIKQEKKYLNYKCKVNATNIIAHNITDSIVEIYNFKLELVHSIKLDQKFDKRFKLNNYEIAFNKIRFVDLYIDRDIDEKLIITCYNYKTIHSKKTKFEISLDEYGFKEKVFKLVDVNDRFFFISGHPRIRCNYSTIICLLNREDENNVYKSFKCDFQSCLIYNAEFKVFGRLGYNFTINEELVPYVGVHDIDDIDSNEPSAILSGNDATFAQDFPS